MCQFLCRQWGGKTHKIYPLPSEPHLIMPGARSSWQRTCDWQEEPPRAEQEAWAQV